MTINVEDEKYWTWTYLNLPDGIRIANWCNFNWILYEKDLKKLKNEKNNY